MPKLVCDGWWEQEGLGRQPMHDLVIDFQDGVLTGSGQDIVGAFAIRGRIVGEHLMIRKQYLGMHAIDYHGSSDGEGVYFGQWSAGGIVGGEWSIRFRTVLSAGLREIRSSDPS